MAIDCKGLWERLLGRSLATELLAAARRARNLELPSGFSERLHARLDAELSRTRHKNM
jgi:hypothetical protein